MYYNPEDIYRHKCDEKKHDKDNNKHHKMQMQSMPMNQMPIAQMPGNIPNPNMNKPPEKLLDLLVEAMKDERADRVKYKTMMEMTCKGKCRRQINFAYEDEGKHYKMFQHIYRQLTGQDIDIPAPKPEKFDSMKEAIESSIEGELEAVELYRRIHAMLPNRMMRDMVFEIITDEQEHATRFVYLCACVKC